MLFHVGPSLADGTMLGYVDGGTGSLIFQVAIGGALSAVYFVTTQWHRLKNWVGNRSQKGSATTDP